MLLVADVVVGGRVRWDVVHHGEGGGRGPVVAVRVLEARGACETETAGQAGEDGLADDVGACDGVFEDFDVAVVFDVAGNVRGITLDFVAGDLGQEVSVVLARGAWEGGSEWLLTLIIS